MKIRNMIGPRTVPCGTPDIIGAGVEEVPCMTTVCILSDKNIIYISLINVHSPKQICKARFLPVSKPRIDKYITFPTMYLYCIVIIQISSLLLLGICIYQSKPRACNLHTNPFTGYSLYTGAYK